MQIDGQFQKTKRKEVYMKLGIGGATAKMKMSAVENRGLDALECCRCVPWCFVQLVDSSKSQLDFQTIAPVNEQAISYQYSN
ncbi:hypothetical protein HO173_010837 [Letharia columbiana]|uniref:Uncharacterized protein n=1 Tax=Letharia columbiana TaxID=112416 RepID=A0A8H6FLW8_9LECA|nr:uncharacterized protein HO173_010837 [Letharia columbiana]KAF6230929.1 hypothetical protein HO173_010837 [Letharia columbiana]